MKQTDARPEGSPAKRPCRTVVWNEDNLAQCEAGKDAKMKIDEPETPWASPPKELYSDDEAPDAGAAGRPADMAHVAARLAAATARPAGVSWGGAAGEGAAGLTEAAPEADPGSVRAQNAKDEAELRQRLFEARRKALQGSYRGVTQARGASAEEPEGEASGSGAAS